MVKEKAMQMGVTCSIIEGYERCYVGKLKTGEWVCVTGRKISADWDFSIENKIYQYNKGKIINVFCCAARNWIGVDGDNK